METVVRDIHFFINLLRMKLICVIQGPILYRTYTLHLRYKTTFVNAV
jgi:hypothetical protein